MNVLTVTNFFHAQTTLSVMNISIVTQLAILMLPILILILKREMTVLRKKKRKAVPTCIPLKIVKTYLKMIPARRKIPEVNH